MSPGLDDYQMADIYSFGVCVWELLHRVDPWGTTTFEQVKENLMNEERPPISINGKDDPKISLLKTLVEICWSQIPSSRPNAKLILSKINSFMEDEPLPRKETQIL